MARELRNLNESLNALAYAALGQSPRVSAARSDRLLLGARSGVALGGAAHDRVAVACHDPAPPGAEGARRPRLERRRDPSTLAAGQRDEVRVAPHEADRRPGSHARCRRIRSALAAPRPRAGPVAVEVAAGADQRQAAERAPRSRPPRRIAGSGRMTQGRSASWMWIGRRRRRGSTRPSRCSSAGARSRSRATPPSSLTAATAASSTSGEQSQRTLPSGVWRAGPAGRSRTSARC